MVHGISTAITPSHASRVKASVDAARQTAAGSSSCAAETAPSAPDFRLLFTGKTTVVPAPVAPPPAPPTAEAVFGPNPWIANPTGLGPNGLYTYNSYYFATPDTAAKVAQMVGGTVVQTNAITCSGGAFSQSQPNQMVQLPDGRMINPGLIASFYTHGFPQSYIDRMIAQAVNEA